MDDVGGWHSNYQDRMDIGRQEDRRNKQQNRDFIHGRAWAGFKITTNNRADITRAGEVELLEGELELLCSQRKDSSAAELRELLNIRPIWPIDNWLDRKLRELAEYAA